MFDNIIKCDQLNMIEKNNRTDLAKFYQRALNYAEFYQRALYYANFYQRALYYTKFDLTVFLLVLNYGD